MNRSDILKAAAQIISEKGYHATSMQDIAAAVNLQKASLYYHFNNKQEILLDLLDIALDLLIQRLSAVAELRVPPSMKLRLAMRTYLETLADHRDLAAVLLLEYRSLEPDLYQRHLPRRDRFEGVWRSILNEGMEQGVFACTSASLAARALLGVLNWTIFWYRREGSLSVAEIADQFSDLFLDGLIVRANGFEVGPQ